jgi:hypothetical protein
MKEEERERRTRKPEKKYSSEENVRKNFPC